MMASHYNGQHPLTIMMCLAALVWIISCTTDVTGSSPPKQVKGEIGGNATFNCFPEEKANATFFYLQINTTFVNGYYEDLDITIKWNNTVLDGRTVHMYELKPSHTGDYKCIMQYKNGTVHQEHIYLSVTAKFSEPTVTKSCEEGNRCFVTCTSHGGHPGIQMKINGPMSKNTSGQMWKVVNSSQMSNPITMMYNSTSTAVFDCSRGEMTHITCSVGEVTSHMFSVCEHQTRPPDHTIVIIATICVVVFVLLVMLFLYCRCKKRQEHRQIRREGSEQQMETLRGRDAEEGHLA